MIFLCLFLLIVSYQYIKILRIGLDGKGGVHWYDYVITAPLVAVVWGVVLIILYTILIIKRIKEAVMRGAYRMRTVKHRIQCESCGKIFTHFTTQTTPTKKTCMRCDERKKQERTRRWKQKTLDKK